MKAIPHNRKAITAARLKMLEHEYNAAWGQRDLQRCADLLGKVLEINRRSASALVLLGRVHGMQYEYDQAIEYFERAVEVSPKSEQVKVLIEAGNMAGGFFDPSIAEQFFELAVEQADTVLAKLALAEYSIRLRKRDVATTLVDEVLRLTPMDPVASFLWCRLHEERFEECVKRLSRLMTVQTPELKARAGYQLAKLLDGAGDYDGAMRALHAAKTGLMSARDIVAEPRKKVRASHRNLAKDFSEAKRDQWQKDADCLGEPHKLVLLGGHPRSGTTLLEQVLDSHPGVISAEEAENFSIFAFGPLSRAHPPTNELMELMDACTPEALRTARDCYFSSMDACLDESVGSRVLVDKNPSLTSLVPVMFRFFPEIKFVTMIRDPRDVILSCYMQSFVPVSAVSANYLTLEDTADEYVDVMSVWTDVAKRLERSVCEVRYEDMVDDLEGNARKVLDFLGLDWNEAVMEYDRHAREKVVRSPTASAVTEKVHSRAKNRWKNYEKHLEPVFEKLSGSLSALGYE